MKGVLAMVSTNTTIYALHLPKGVTSLYKDRNNINPIVSQ